MNYDFTNVESGVQDQWRRNEIFKVDLESEKKCYVLEMFPYPSGNLHIGHLRNYTIGDVCARYKNAQGYSVLHPMGWDSFGLPAENAAIENNQDPYSWTMQNISNMRQQLSMIGLSYDWSREIITCQPEYYIHEQKLFLQMLADGLVYKKKSLVNWDPVDKTVLANEQVIDGIGWRSGAAVEKKEMLQWFAKITDYTDNLLQDIEKLDLWPEKVRSMQKKWIGKTSGYYFKIKLFEDGLTVFIKHPEEIQAAEFCLMPFDHPLCYKLAQRNRNIKTFIDQKHCNTKRDYIFSGIYLDHPAFEKERLPLYITNFIQADAILGSSSNNYGIEGYSVINNSQNIAFTNYTKVTKYILKDWCISRQRKWGCPIPVIYCKNCGMRPSPILPVTSATPNIIKCDKCGCDAPRDMDTFDTFFESSWYYVAFCSEKKDMCDNNNWLPVDYYIGGVEHAVMHLLYSRFFARVMKKYKYINCCEPFTKLITQGMVCHKTFQTHDGKWLFPEDAIGRADIKIGRAQKMSKSKKNVVNPVTIINEYGADSARLFIMSDTPIERDFEWSLEGVKGALKYINKFYSLMLVINNYQQSVSSTSEENITKLESIINNVTKCYESLQINKAIAELRTMHNIVEKLIENDQITNDYLRRIQYALLRMFEPVMPHITQYVWSVKLGNATFLYNEPWVSLRSVVKKNIKISVQINGKLKSVIDISTDNTQGEITQKAQKCIAHHLVNKKIMRKIFIRNKVVNFVVTNE